MYARGVDVVEVVSSIATLCGSLACPAALVVLFVWLRRSHARTQAAFAAMAAARGLTVVDPQPSRASAAAEGPWGEGRLRVEHRTHTEHSTSSPNGTTVSVTVLQYTFGAPLRMGLQLGPRRPDLAVMLGLRTELQTGLPALDAAARIVADDATYATALFTSPEVVTPLLAAVERDASVTDETIVSSVSGWITDLARFDAAVGPMAKLAGALTAARSRHRTSWELHLDRVWGAVAVDERARYAPERAALTSSSSAGSVELAVIRGENGLEVRARAVVTEARGLGIAVRPTTTLAALGHLLGSEDLVLGDPAFDAAHSVSARDAAGARALLQRLLPELVLVHASLGPLSLDDAGLTASRPLATFDASTTTAILRALGGIVGAMSVSGAGSSNAYR